MRLFRWFGAFFFLISVGLLIAYSQDSSQSLGEVARELRSHKSASSTPTATPAPTTGPVVAQAKVAVLAKPPEIDEYTNEISFQMYRGDFAKLDEIADKARSTKARFPGGGWKLFTFYTQLQAMPSDATDADWQKHLDFFKRWMTARPQSITARVGLADAYIDYAWVARGKGYADQVTAEGGRLFDERIEQAANVLMEASKLQAKCPHWYYEFLVVGMAQGLDKAQMRQIFDKGVAFAPDYYYLYQQEAFSLLPQWSGDEGDTEAFADETYRKVGGDKGAELYFLIASTLCSECGEFKPEQYSWPRLQAGFAALEKDYGMEPGRLNRFARMAVLYQDKTVASNAFARIGDNCEQSVWGTRAQFDAQRAWAGLSPIPKANEKPAFVLDPQGTEQLNSLLSSASRASSEKRWDDAARDYQTIIDMAKPYPGTDYWIQTAYSRLAVNEFNQGHIEQARTRFDEEIKFITDRNGADSPDIATALDARAMFEMKINDDKHEEEDFLRAIKIREKAKTPAIQYGSELYSIGMLYRKQGKYKQAVEFLKARIPAKEDPDPKKENWWAWSLEALGMAYQDMGQYDQAEKSYDRMIRAMDQTLPVNSLGFVDPLSKMASLYHAMGKEGEAQKVEQRLKTIQEAQGK